MKRILFFLVIALSPFVLKAQKADGVVARCASSAGSDAAYLKDFRIDLGAGEHNSGLRHKNVFPFSKNIRYRFTLCTTDLSGPKLIMEVKDESGRKVLSSFDSKSGKSFSTVEFICNKTGTYHLSFDFMGTGKGSGVGIISLVK